MTEQQPAMRCTRPVRDDDGAIVLFDMWLDGQWLGSRRTVAQCREEFEYAERRRAS
jgi:hypothetical protein